MARFQSRTTSPPPVTYSGNQRMGGCGIAPRCAWFRRFRGLGVILSLPLPVGRTNTPVGRFRRRVGYRIPNLDGSISTFRGKQLLRLEQLATQFGSENARRYSFFPEFLRPATGRLRVALCAQAGDFLGISDSEWLMQFAAGFPRKGTLSQQHTFKREKVPSNPPVPAESLLINNTKRFVYRARRSPARFASALWREAMGQFDAGRQTPP